MAPLLGLLRPCGMVGAPAALRHLTLPRRTVASRPWTRAEARAAREPEAKSKPGTGWNDPTHYFSVIVGVGFAYYFRDSISYMLASEAQKRARDDAKWRAKIDSAPDDVKEARRSAVANVFSKTHNFAQKGDPFAGMAPSDIVKFCDTVAREDGLGDDPFEGMSPEEIQALVERRARRGVS